MKITNFKLNNMLIKKSLHTFLVESFPLLYFLFVGVVAIEPLDEYSEQKVSLDCTRVLFFLTLKSE